MKSFITVTCIILITLTANFRLFSKGVSSLAMRNSLEEEIKHSDIIVEGRGIGIKHFRSNGNIYTAAKVRILKIFKGNVSDSIIEIIYEGGCMIKDSVKGGGTVEECNVSSSGGFGISEGSDGIILLSINNTPEKFAKMKEAFLLNDFIKYHHTEIVAHHTATSQGVAYDNLETDLFQRIEMATGQKRKILGRNSFEIESAPNNTKQ